MKRIIIENVWEFIGWGPVDSRTGKPLKARKGEYFKAWIETIRRLGFEPEWRKLNAADFGDATTRQRFILMARSDSKSVHWPVPTHARKRPDGELALFPSVKPWRPARDIIDWNIRGRSIFNRKKPLAPKTLARIYAGAVKFNWPEPFLVILRNHMAGQSIDGPVPATSAKPITCCPFLIYSLTPRRTAVALGRRFPDSSFSPKRCPSQGLPGLKRAEDIKRRHDELAAMTPEQRQTVKREQQKRANAKWRDDYLAGRLDEKPQRRVKQ